jgi:hypothetical protein
MKTCDKDMTFSDCELAIVRKAIDKGQEQISRKKVNAPEIKEIMAIMENFIKEKKIICYGGTAINNILPIEDQFYDKELDIPDYDCFSATAVKDAKELADIYYKKGFTEVEAKSGQHYGTYKVFVNFIPVADLTFLVPEIYDNMKKEVIKVDGILYAPPNFLRMSMYLELSRPEGDINRWEKVLKRLVLLNKHYPLYGTKCSRIETQRIFEETAPKSLDLRTLSEMSVGRKSKTRSKPRVSDKTADKTNTKTTNKSKTLSKSREKSKTKSLVAVKTETLEKYNFNFSKEIYFIARDSLIDQGVVFFGGYANAMYSRYLPKKQRVALKKIPDFDVLSTDPEKTATIVKERLEDLDITNVKIIKHDKIGELLAVHYEIRVGLDTIAFVYEPLACHSYNVIRINNRAIKIATIDTMMSFYLAFYYIERPYYDRNRILCMCEYLFKVQQKNRLKQKGLLKRFSLECYGDQPTIEDMRAEKTKKFQQLKDNRNGKEFQMWFLRYIPRENDEKKNGNNKKSQTKTATKSSQKTTKKNKKASKNKTRKSSGFLANLGL